MRSTKNKLVVLINLIISLNSFNGYYLAENHKNSIIKIFCVNNFKEEMVKAQIEFSQEIANKTCECYLEEFAKTTSHQKAKTKCQLEAQEKFNL